VVGEEDPPLGEVGVDPEVDPVDPDEVDPEEPEVGLEGRE
jgi:hypothetical protein